MGLFALLSGVAFMASGAFGMALGTHDKFGPLAVCLVGLTNVVIGCTLVIVNKLEEGK